MGKAKKQEETAAQRALAQVARQQLDDFRRRWQPLQTKMAENIVRAGGADSFERRRADTMAKVDTTAAFGRTADAIDSTAAASGEFGGSAHKLAIVGSNADQATSSGLSAVQADQAITDQTVQGLGAVTALGRGERAQAVNNMGRVAALSGQQAQADAQASLASRMGDAQLAGQIVGMGAGLGMNSLGAAAPGMTIDPNGIGIVPGGSPDSATGATIHARR